ncbi:hypothetical protein NN3_08220 [Nocardia neocaledoniensis NBRC 108232]|uniref:Excreted virulence factor EspC (Type VII ESX diderm) n=1 Tax=Nocardia neocaledoniensis TaxID=236511 RepID=A0A317NSH1_9NOCA|nr:hypothetical protein [Nocardia neocaledoniensis]PWV78045.1 hypothetical protein DFR69_103651 [Nocardia neocaledoniensis]GEM29815.1 hypothetical protein NN3_08220 [Nocardia neocaledoniensis NBRC 108232]
MAAPNILAQQFQTLASEAAAGRLIIEVDAAERCAKLCEDYITDLNGLARRTQRMVTVDSFGDLNSAKELAKKFANLAEGGEGSGSYFDAARQHIEILTQMADMYRKAGAAYKNCDEATQLAIKQQTTTLD